MKQREEELLSCRVRDESRTWNCDTNFFRQVSRQLLSKRSQPFVARASTLRQDNATTEPALATQARAVGLKRPHGQGCAMKCDLEGRILYVNITR